MQSSLFAVSCFMFYHQALSKSVTLASWPTAAGKKVEDSAGPCWAHRHRRLYSPRDNVTRSSVSVLLRYWNSLFPGACARRHTEVLGDSHFSRAGLNMKHASVLFYCMDYIPFSGVLFDVCQSR